MKMKAREALDSYYQEAESWGKDRQDRLRGSRRVAWIVASVSAAIALLEALALFALAPLKTVEPYTLLVDKQTGFVQALKPLDPGMIAGDKALTQSFLVQYVIARESFDVASIQADYRKVALFSEGAARADYIAHTQPSSPDSPLVRFPRTTVVETRVKSVSPMGGTSAMVRFDTIRRDAGGQAQPAQAWVAVIRYHYSGEPMKIEDRFVNPLGFEVTSYQRNAETLPQPEPTSQESTAPATAPGSPLSGSLPRPTPTADPDTHRLPNGDIQTL